MVKQVVVPDVVKEKTVPDFSWLYSLVGILLPFECMQLVFMQKALIGLVLLAPMAAIMGVQVVNFRMAFFADAISHTSFAGVALGILLGVSPYWTMPTFALIVGVLIVYVKRRSLLSSDTVIGVFFSGVVAFGLAVVSRKPEINKDILKFIYGDILTIGDKDIFFLIILFVALIIFQIRGYNRLLYTGLNPILAETHGVKVPLFQYLFAALLSLVVILSVWWVGIFLVTGLLIIPAASARNFANSAGSMFWWAIIISASSAISGLILSAQSWAHTASGATIILISFFWFLLSLVYIKVRKV